jgi:hypothetical protein
MKKAILLVLFMTLLASMATAWTMTLRPNSQGYYAQWTNTGCSAGTLEWQCVDENPANTSDSLYITTASKYESFAFQDTGLTSEIINSVTLYFYGIRYSTTRYMFQPLIRSNSTDYLGSLKNLTASYAYYSQVYTTNPATGTAWTVAQVNALEAGMKSYTATYGGRIAQVYAVVDYSFPDSCSDTDGGNVITTFGTVTGFYNNSAYANNDTCVDSGNINEYYCSGAYKQNQQQSCGTDFYGSNYCLGSLVYRNFTDYYCSYGACGSTTSAQFVENCTYGCTAGNCNPIPDSCSDSDGNNKYVFGSVYGYLNTSFYNYSDYCANSNDVMENYCSGAYWQIQQQSCGTDASYNFCIGSLLYQNYTDYYCGSGRCSSTVNTQLLQNCTNGCYNGYCNSCSDTDGGQIDYVQGTISGVAFGSPFNMTDYCLSSTLLREYYCAYNSYAWTNMTCTGNTTCTSGACS